MSELPSQYQQLRDRLGEIHDLNKIGWVLNWDQRTMMAPGGAGVRPHHRRVDALRADVEAPAVALADGAHRDALASARVAQVDLYSGLPGCVSTSSLMTDQSTHSIGTPTDLPARYHRAELHFQSTAFSTRPARTGFR